MPRIQREPKYVAALAQIVFAQLFRARFLIMTTRTQTCELIERWKRLRNRPRFPTASGDGNTMVDGACRLDPTDLETGFTKRMQPQLEPAQSLPTLRIIGPPTHAIIADTSRTGAGRAATPSAIVNATSGSMRPVDFRFDNFRFPAASVSTLAFVTAIPSTGCAP
jgi:hypothetical protein